MTSMLAMKEDSWEQQKVNLVGVVVVVVFVEMDCYYDDHCQVSCNYYRTAITRDVKMSSKKVFPWK